MILIQSIREFEIAKIAVPRPLGDWNTPVAEEIGYSKYSVQNCALDIRSSNLSQQSIPIWCTDHAPRNRTLGIQNNTPKIFNSSPLSLTPPIRQPSQWRSSTISRSKRTVCFRATSQYFSQVGIAVETLTLFRFPQGLATSCSYLV